MLSYRHTHTHTHALAQIRICYFCYMRVVENHSMPFIPDSYCITPNILAGPCACISALFIVNISTEMGGMHVMYSIARKSLQLMTEIVLFSSIENYENG